MTFHILASITIDLCLSSGKKNVVEVSDIWQIWKGMTL